MPKETLDRLIACNHVITGAWTQKVVNGPHRAKCDGCGKVIKRSADVDVYRRRPAIGDGSPGSKSRVLAALALAAGVR
jgi:hypothetical protein